MIPARLLDCRGAPVALGNELGRGGEGVVFDIRSRPDLVAKVYLKPPSQDHADKLAAMVGIGNAGLLRIAAWPTETIHDPTGAVVGFSMPKVGGHEPIFKLYGPRQRLQEFPKADWRFLIHAAANAARAFSLVHSLGLVIGDVNHGNLVVGQDATVRMIDCDSFQLSSGHKTWFCPVGVGTHQPPEMQGHDSFAGIPRTPNHDAFGLAVIVFQLLCMARHPFAGRFVGPGEPPSIEEAIAASRYAYSRDRARTKLEPPPGSLPMDELTANIQELFEKAFAPTAARSGRPGAEEWVRALEDLGSNLKACRTNAAHFHKSGSGTCPWCALESATGVTLFPVVFIPGAGGTSGMAALWQEFGRLPELPKLGPAPTLPTSNQTPSPEAREAARKEGLLRLTAWTSLAASTVLALTVAPVAFRIWIVGLEGLVAYLLQRRGLANRKGPFQVQLDAVRRDWVTLEQAWLSSNPNAVNQFRSKIALLKAEYDGLPRERAKRLQILFEKRRDKQLLNYLDRFHLGTTKIPGMGPTRIATLASHGMATAGDIVESRILAVPGFGQGIAANLVAWRRSLEASFTFDPNQAVSASDQAAIERDISVQKTELERDVGTNLERLKTAIHGAATYRQALHGRAAELGPKYAQALVDASVVIGGRQGHVSLLVLAAVVASVSLLSARSPGKDAVPIRIALTSPRPNVSSLAGSQPSEPRTPSEARRPGLAAPGGQQHNTVGGQAVAQGGQMLGNADATALESTLSRLRRLQAGSSSVDQSSAPSVSVPAKPDPRTPEPGWPHQTDNGVRWRLQVQQGVYNLLVDLGMGRVATVHVAPQFQLLTLDAMNIRADHVREVIASKYSLEPGAYAFSRDGDVSPDR